MEVILPAWYARPSPLPSLEFNNSGKEGANLEFNSPSGTAPPFGSDSSQEEGRDFGSPEDAGIKESEGLSTPAPYLAPPSGLVDPTSVNSCSGAPLGETETQELAGSDQEHSGNDNVSKPDHVTHNQTNSPPLEEEELPDVTPPAQEYPMPIKKYPPWLASMVKFEAWNGRTQTRGEVPYLRERTEPAPGSSPNRDGENGPPDDYPNRKGSAPCGLCCQHRALFGTRVHSCECRHAHHATCSILKASATGNCPLCHSGVDFSLVVGTVTAKHRESLAHRVQNLNDSLMEDKDWERLTAERKTLLASSSAPGKAYATGLDGENYFSPLRTAKAMRRLHASQRRAPHRIRYGHWVSRARDRNYLTPRSPQSLSKKVLKNIHRRVDWRNRGPIRHKLDLLGDLLEKILEIRWATRGIYHRSDTDLRKPVRGIHIGKVGSDKASPVTDLGKVGGVKPTPASRFRQRAKVRLRETRAVLRSPQTPPLLLQPLLRLLRPPRRTLPHLRRHGERTLCLR